MSARATRAAAKRRASTGPSNGDGAREESASTIASAPVQQHEQRQHRRRRQVKKARKSYTLEVKLDAIQRVRKQRESHPRLASIGNVSRDTGIPFETLRKWLPRSDELNDEVARDIKPNRRKHCLRKPAWQPLRDVVEAEVLKRMAKRKEEGQPVTAKVVLAMATQCLEEATTAQELTGARQVEAGRIKFGWGWMRGFQERNKIVITRERRPKTPRAALLSSPLSPSAAAGDHASGDDGEQHDADEQHGEHDDHAALEDSKQQSFELAGAAHVLHLGQAGDDYLDSGDAESLGRSPGGGVRQALAAEEDKLASALEPTEATSATAAAATAAGTSTAAPRPQAAAVAAATAAAVEPAEQTASRDVL